MAPFLATLAACLAACVTLSHASPVDASKRPVLLHGRSTDKYNTSKSLVVDLGYALYNGTANTTSGINTWLGMRYARSTEETRWQKPEAPHKNRSTIMQANTYAPNCPSGNDSPEVSGYNFTGSEDCLFLNVVAPQNATKLPVLVWIHGGGYGQGQGNQDLTVIQGASGNAFVGVVIQYRLAGFGFLSSADVQKHGIVNAGLYDQQYALKWVQKYIHLFGGDPNHVTISGESAGGGSVMLQGMAMGGTLGTSLFRNLIAASPYLPTQAKYDDEGPTQNYLNFAQLVGCYSGPITGQQGNSHSDGSIFKCLVSKDSETLQNASSYVSSSVLFGQWAFIPVTDGKFVQNLPSVQTKSGKMNGKNILTANNADEGVGFVPQNISTEDDFVNFARTVLPRFSDSDITKLLAVYPSTNASDNPSALNYSTSGTGPATALNESTFGNGQQQRANNLYAETTFVCPSYWLANGYSRGGGASAYHYQYSVIGAYHGADVSSYFGPIQPNIAPAFAAGIMSIWYSMVVNDNPSVPNSNFSALHNYPTWTIGKGAKMLDLNETGGVPYPIQSAQGIEIVQYSEPGINVDFSEVDAFNWEGGRGERCEFLQSLGPMIPA